MSTTLKSSSSEIPQARSDLAREFLKVREQDHDDDNVGPALAFALLHDAIEHHASDIHLDPAGDYYRVRLRIDGGLVNVAAGDSEEGQRLINQFRVLCQVDPNEVNFAEGRWSGEVDGKAIDLRLSFVPTVHGDKMVVRVLPQDRPELTLGTLIIDDEQCEIIRDSLAARAGMVVVAGPTGSGKTTLLFSMAKELYRPDCSIVTLEDPVEMRFAEMTQIDVGSPASAMTIADGVQLSLRLDPDYLLIGETRDAMTARAAVAAANAGRTLMTSMHTEDAGGVISNLRYWGLEDREIANAVRMVIATRLVRRLCVRCKRKGSLSDVDRRWLESQCQPLPEVSYHAVGCSECFDTGFRGRISLQHVWKLSPEQSQQIRDGKQVNEITSQEQTLMESAMMPVETGETSVSEIRNAGLPRATAVK